MNPRRVSVALGLCALTAALGLLASTEAANLGEVKKLIASDAAFPDFFGDAATIDGDTAIVGARNKDNATGAAYVFARDQGGIGNWGEVKKLTASDAQSGDQFGVGVAISGDTAIVGASSEGAGGLDAGAAYIFERDQGGMGNWGQVKKLTASDAQSGDFFGISVGLSSDTAIVGAIFEDAGGFNAGAAYVFDRNQGGADNWGQTKKLLSSDIQSNDRFGRSVAISGDTAIAGASDENTGGNAAGAAYIFDRDQGGANNWGETKKLVAADPGVNDLFGQSTALSGDTAVVGAPGENQAGDFAGAAYVFERDQGGPGNWGQVEKLVGADTQAADNFGISVAISVDTVLTGAAFEDTEASDAGAAYVFGRDQGGPGNWGELQKLTASDAQADDVFGGSVAVSGTNAVVGAPGEDAGGDFAGAAYVFQELSSTVDTDQDGCPDKREAGSNPSLGGGRDPDNFWDFFDTPALPGNTRDKAVSVGDINRIVARFGSARPGGPPDKATALAEALSAPPPAPAYHASYDRTAAGVLSGPPDGAVATQDINRAVQQFGHNCL